MEHSSFILSGELFEDVQMNCIFPDGKTFVDCIPVFSAEEINNKYTKEKTAPGFSLDDFVSTNFLQPESFADSHNINTEKDIEKHLENLWQVLTRQPDKAGGSLIPLPNPYIVPGGRFGEIYYWDSYFTMLGLKASGKISMLENMVNNFSWLIDRYGYIPNGNRQYFLGRSQPPFFSLMVKLLASSNGNSILVTYLPQLQKEYAFWMKDSEMLTPENHSVNHSVLMPGAEVLNRYWDEFNSARPESFREDTKLGNLSKQPLQQLYRNLRAGAESGWDFSSRWFKREMEFDSIHTTEIVPVDLNCLLYNLEQTIAAAFALEGDLLASEKFKDLASKRKNAIEKYCWNAEKGFYFDYDISAAVQKNSYTLAATFPLFFCIATEKQAALTATIIKNNFVKAGGVVTSLVSTEQQWDAPNGWAPLQWICIIGLENYGHHELASTIAKKWITLNKDVFNRTGKLMEKYNVIDTGLEAGGGEYPGQDGFGWTNGVLLALIKKYGS